MRIKSKFKDYYDFLGGVHGEDPNINYVRLPHKGDLYEQRDYKSGKLVTKMVEHDFFSVPVIVGLPHFQLKDEWSDRGWKVDTIYVCGIAYCIIGFEAKTEMVHRNKQWVYEKKGEDIPFTVFDLDHQFAKDYVIWAERLLPQQHRSIAELHKVSGMPVCRTSGSLSWGSKTTLIDTRVPVLSDYNFGKILPPEKIWQDIQYWLSNLINESPDMAPPPRPPQSNAEKLDAHGFDKRWSFRHRK
jgi:hypothetical protein